jgi:hypothetical protein
MRRSVSDDEDDKPEIQNLEVPVALLIEQYTLSWLVVISGH